MDFSGTVKQVEEDDMSSDFKQGDEVYGQASVLGGGSGAFAELAQQTRIVSHTSQKP